MAPPVDRRLIGASRRARAHLLAAGALGAVSAGLILAQAALLAHVIAAAALRHATLAELRGSLVALAAVLLARALVAGGFELSGRLGAVRVMSELRGRLLSRLVCERPGERPAGTRTGELASTAVQGVEALEAYFAGYLPQLVLAALVPLAVIAFVASFDAITAAILALTVPILIVFMVLIGKGARAQADRRWRALALLGAHFLDVVQGLATLRAFGRERAQQRTLAQVGERYRGETMGTLRVAFLSALVLELCAMIGTALVAATIGVQLVAGALALQAGMTVLLLAPELYGPLRLVGQQFHASADAVAASGRIFEAIAQPTTTEPAPAPPARAGAPLAVTPRPLPRTRSTVPDPARAPVRLRRVSYRYPASEALVLDEVDFELAPGRTTALIGPSGAGKSTIARLLMRFAEPSAGVISCGGVDLRELDLAAWRRRIAWVPQRPTLFAGSVAENIALYEPHADERAIARAAAAAGASAFIAELPQGLGTQLGDAGRRLSAGQAQRIALARAFLAERPLLLLDEPTAHVDAARAREIGESIAELARGRTTLLIAHDERLVDMAHERFELDGGRLRAPHERLAA